MHFPKPSEEQCAGRPRPRAPARTSSLRLPLSPLSSVLATRRHLRAPGEAIVLYGIAPFEVIAEALKLANTALDETGKRKLRNDGGVLVAGVVGWPGDPDLLTGYDNYIERDAYSSWQQDVIGWLKKSHGASLRYVVKHADENRPHLHFAALPSLGSSGALDWTHAHPGMRDKRAAAAQGKSKREQEKAYREALIVHQNSFYEDVGSQWGHARVGPMRERITRMEALAKQKFAQMEEDLKREIEQKGRETVIQAEREGWTRYHTNRAEFECRIGDLIERNESLTREIASLRERLAELMPDLLP